MGRCATVSLRLALGTTTSSQQEVRLDQKTLLPDSRKTRLGLYASRERERAALFGQLRSHRPACEDQTACPPVPSGAGSLSGGPKTGLQSPECAESILVDPLLKARRLVVRRLAVGHQPWLRVARAACRETCSGGSEGGWASKEAPPTRLHDFTGGDVRHESTGKRPGRPGEEGNSRPAPKGGLGRGDGGGDGETALTCSGPGSSWSDMEPTG